MSTKSQSAIKQLKAVLDSLGIEVIRYRPEKPRPIITKAHGTLTVKKLSEKLRDFPEIINFLELFVIARKEGDMSLLMYDYAEQEDILGEEEKEEKQEKQLEIPNELKNLTLNCDMTAKSRDERFFLTHPDESVSRISGDFYLLCHGMSAIDAASRARKVIPEYQPRTGPGVHTLIDDGKEETIFNKYTQPPWAGVELNEPAPKAPPPIFKKLIDHLFPIIREREYFYDWLHASLFDRAFVYLVLQGAPGIGKNRLKLIMRALHGHPNSADGKRSTLIDKFNSQLTDSTLVWFDELSYDHDMENIMKELQNDSISIERKGVDATRASKIHASLVISNNKPRDNYISFDARKFVPLQLTDKRLEVSMTPKEIDLLTRKVEDQDSEHFDKEFLTRIALWLKNRGKTGKWPNLEYRGPHFWALAHTSMSKWQKKAASVVLQLKAGDSGRIIHDREKGFLWSSVENAIQRKNAEKTFYFPDFTSVKYFFDVFRDGKGQKAFETTLQSDDMMGDFYVKVILQNLKIATEASVMGQRRDNGRDDEEESGHYDL